MEVQTLRQKIAPVLRQSGVRGARLFGSSARGKPSPNDIDILVELDDKVSLLGFINLKHRLEDALGQKVDLVEYKSLKAALKDNVLQSSVSLLEQ